MFFTQSWSENISIHKHTLLFGGRYRETSSSKHESCRHYIQVLGDEHHMSVSPDFGVVIWAFVRDALAFVVVEVSGAVHSWWCWNKQASKHQVCDIMTQALALPFSSNLSNLSTRCKVWATTLLLRIITNVRYGRQIYPSTVARPINVTLPQNNTQTRTPTKERALRFNH